MHTCAVHSLCIMLSTTLQQSFLLQGSSATDACDAGCAQHCLFNPTYKVVLTSPLCKCGEVNLLPVAYMQVIEFGTKHVVTVLIMQFDTKVLLSSTYIAQFIGYALCY